MSEPIPEFVPDKARFVTVKEAISLLGLSERTIRRYVADLPLNAVATPPKGATKYSLNALRKLAGLATDATAQEPAYATAAPHDAGALPPDATAAPDALLDHLRGEVEYLRRALAEAQTNLRESHANERAALAELAKTREQNAVMIAATAAGRISPAIASDSAETGGTVSTPLTTSPQATERETGATNGVPTIVPETADRQETGKSEVPENYSAQNNEATNPPRRWWEIWKR